MHTIAVWIHTVSKIDRITDLPILEISMVNLNLIGGEQYELSFKIWQCHGRMLETACARVTHIYRARKKAVNQHLHYDFLHRVGKHFENLPYHLG